MKDPQSISEYSKSRTLKMPPKNCQNDTFRKVIAYKINTQKFVAFLYNNNELSEGEIRKTISLTIAPKRINYVRINITKAAKDLYTENCKTLMKRNKRRPK